MRECVCERDGVSECAYECGSVFEGEIPSQVGSGSSDKYTLLYTYSTFSMIFYLLLLSDHRGYRLFSGK